MVNFTDFSKVDICNALAFGVLLAEDEDGERKGRPNSPKNVLRYCNIRTIMGCPKSIGVATEGVRGPPSPFGLGPIVEF